MEKEYEYIVVGSGAGGGPVAANLANAGHSVLLLEAGGRSTSLNAEVPAFHANASEEPEMSWRFFVRHYADEEQQRRDSKYVPQEGGVFYPRAGTLGGCTAHNALILGYPNNWDWDNIAEITGDDSWRARKMRRYFQAFERCGYRPNQRWLQRRLGFNPSRHGFGGWLASGDADPRLMLGDDELLDLLTRAAKRSLFSFGNLWDRLLGALLTALDPNDWWSIRKNAVGTRRTPITVDNGRRCAARERLLSADPNKLTIQLGALATRVLFDENNRAVGVEYLEGENLYRAAALHRPGQEGVPRQARASREVILAGGAFNTPQLLQLSGIGPAALLREHGIPVRVDLPGVGENLQDRYEATVVLKMKKRFALLEGARMRPPTENEEPDPQLEQWRQGKGVYTTNGTLISIIRKSHRSRPLPDLFIFGLVTKFRGYFPGYSLETQQARDYFTWAVLKGHTNNTAGRVAIRSRDPRDVPAINFRYFGEGNDKTEEDLDSVVTGVKYARKLSASFAHLVEREEVPGPAVQDDEQIRRFVRDEAWGHHASCTCKIGADGDPMAVLDSKFRVRGTQGLRVVDASVFPRIPGLFIMLSVYMIAEKASEAILADAGPSLPYPSLPRGPRGERG